MHEEPVDRSRDPWIERKRRFDLDEAESRFRPTHDPDTLVTATHEQRYSDPTVLRNPNSPRSQLPSIGHFPPSDDPVMQDDAAAGALKRRRLADGPERDDRRREDLGPSSRSPSFRRNELPPMPPRSNQRYLDERDAYLDGARSPSNGVNPPRPNGRLSPHERSGRSPGSGGGPLPPIQDAPLPAQRPSVLSPLYDGEHSPSVPGLARRRGDAAQAKASRLHIDTGSSSAFDSHALAKGQGVAKSAPPQKLTFGIDSRDQPAMPFDQSQRYTQPGTQLAAMRTEQRAVSSGRLAEHVEPFRRDERDDTLGLREARMPDLPHTANPLARHAPGSRMGPGYVPQTATLPSPAYHTTQFARGPGGPARNLPNPPMTARLPDHLRSPPSSKSHFLSLFSDFYDSLHDSRTLKATLEDQIRRSNTLLQTLQSSRRVLEETVERRVREERVQWEGRVRGLEARVRELETQTGSNALDEGAAVNADSAVRPVSNGADASTRAGKDETAPDASSDQSAHKAEETDELHDEA